MLESDSLSEIKYLLECYRNTGVDDEKFLKRIGELHESGLISNHAYAVVSKLLEVADEQKR